MSDPLRKCIVVGCWKKHHAAGFCGAHYEANRKYGSPLASRGPAKERVKME
jgi:hypothetical protein